MKHHSHRHVPIVTIIVCTKLLDLENFRDEPKYALRVDLPWSLPCPLGVLMV